MRVTFQTRCIVLLVIAGLCLSQLPRIDAQELGQRMHPTQERDRVFDISLNVSGLLQGQLLNGQGLPISGQRVGFRQGDGIWLEATTNERGEFAVKGLKGGLCEIVAGRTAVACRCWTANAAPPSAASRMLLIADGDIQRGQRPIGDLFGGPFVIGLLLAAAIAIPIAVHNSQDDAS